MSNKDDAEETNKECASLQKIEQVELKRARVENIVSGMRASPLPVPVNGCKKRKLYHPQQHDNSVAERHSNMNDIVDPSDDEDENLCSAEIRKKVVEKNALKNQLRSVQEQMAELQQKYVQLCTRGIHQDSLDHLEHEEITSDVDQEDDRSVSSPEKAASLLTPTPTPTSTPVAKDVFPPPASTPAAQTTVSPSITKLLKFPPQNVAMPPINPLHPTFNGALSFLQHQMLEQQQQQSHVQSHHHHHHPTHPHPALSNAAAMYLGLGVSQKLLMEQEARMAKEAALAAAAVAAEHQQQLSSRNSSAAMQQRSQLPQHHNSPHGPHSQSHPNASVKGSCSPVRSKSEQSPDAGHINHQTSHPAAPQLSRSNEFSDRLQMMTKNNANVAPSTFDLDAMADALKTKITTVMSDVIDDFFTQVLPSKQLSRPSDAPLTTEQLNKDLLLASQLLDRKSPRPKIIDRGTCAASSDKNPSLSFSSNAGGYTTPTKSTPSHCNTTSTSQPQNYSHLNQESGVNSLTRSSGNPFSAGKMNSSTMNSAAAALYSSINNLSNSHLNPFCLSDMRADPTPSEQSEALSLVVAPKKKRHKVTDTRITPRTVSRILAQDGLGCPPPSMVDSSGKFGGVMASTNGTPESPPPRPFHVPSSASMLPVSLPTSVAIPNPSLHESQVFSPYSPFYSQHHMPPHMQSSSPPGMGDQLRDSPPLPHHSPLFHPALLAAAQQQQQQQQQHQQQQHHQHQQQHHQRASSSPDFMNVRPSSGLGGDSLGPGSECNSMDYEGMTPTISFSMLHFNLNFLMIFHFVGFSAVGFVVGNSPPLRVARKNFYSICDLDPRKTELVVQVKFQAKRL